jgi:hypothetical protein
MLIYRNQPNTIGYHQVYLSLRKWYSGVRLNTKKPWLNSGMM